MDHSKMDHSKMDHSMPGMGDDSEMCSMAMLLTWGYKNTCVVSSKWHIKTINGMFLSCLAIAALSYLYEYFKFKINNFKLKNKINKMALISPQTSPSRNTSALLHKKNQEIKIKESVLYGFQIFYSFMLMLVFMTYNGWLMASLVLGAIAGHFHWGSLPSTLSDGTSFTTNSLLSEEEIDESSMACH